MSENNSIFFESVVPFKQINNEFIPTKPFLEASKSIVQFVDLLGTTFKPVKADIDGNVNKLNNLFESDSTKYFNLNDIVKIEKTTLSESEFHIGTDALTWLNRALLYNQTFLTFFLKEYKDLPEDVESLDELPEDLNKHFHLAYDLTLKKYHNWFVQKIFGVCLMAAPSRTSLLTYLGYLNSGIQQSNLKQLIIDSIEKYLLLLKANTDAVSILLLSHGIQP